MGNRGHLFLPVFEAPGMSTGREERLDWMGTWSEPTLQSTKHCSDNWLAECKTVLCLGVHCSALHSNSIYHTSFQILFLSWSRLESFSPPSHPSLSPSFTTSGYRWYNQYVRLGREITLWEFSFVCPVTWRLKFILNPKNMILISHRVMSFKKKCLFVLVSSEGKKRKRLIFLFFFNISAIFKIFLLTSSILSCFPPLPFRKTVMQIKIYNM